MLHRGLDSVQNTYADLTRRSEAGHSRYSIFASSSTSASSSVPISVSVSSSSRCGSTKQRLRPWLERMIDGRNIPGLYWINMEKTKFRIPWKHGGKRDWTPDNSRIFMEWARHTGRYREDRDEPDYAVWKTRLRCALNKANDIEEVKAESCLDCSEPYRVYLLKPKRGVSSTKDASVATTSVGTSIETIHPHQFHITQWNHSQNHQPLSDPLLYPISFPLTHPDNCKDDRATPGGCEATDEYAYDTESYCSDQYCNLHWTPSTVDSNNWTPFMSDNRQSWATATIDNNQWTTAALNNTKWTTVPADNKEWITATFDNKQWSTASLENKQWTIAVGDSTDGKQWCASPVDLKHWPTIGPETKQWTTKELDTKEWTTDQCFARGEVIFKDETANFSDGFDPVVKYDETGEEDEAEGMVRRSGKNMNAILQYDDFTRSFAIGETIAENDGEGRGGGGGETVGSTKVGYDYQMMVPVQNYCLEVQKSKVTLGHVL